MAERLPSEPDSTVKRGSHAIHTLPGGAMPRYCMTIDAMHRNG